MVGSIHYVHNDLHYDIVFGLLARALFKFCQQHTRPQSFSVKKQALGKKKTENSRQIVCPFLNMV